MTNGILLPDPVLSLRGDGEDGTFAMLELADPVRVDRVRGDGIELARMRWMDGARIPDDELTVRED